MKNLSKLVAAILLTLCSISSARADFTIVLDFVEQAQGATSDIFGNQVSAFDVTGYGFTPSEFDVVTNAVLDRVRDHYYGIPTTGQDARSPIPDESQLALDFVIGNVGTDPGLNDEYYVIQIGSRIGTGGSLGVAGLSSVRSSGGTADPFNRGIGHTFGSVFTNNINGLFGVGNALISGNLEATVNAISGTLSHEVAHALSLLHLNKAGSTTPSGLPPIMGTGAIDLPNVDRIALREFAFSGTNSQNGGATQFHVNQLVGAVGLRSIAVPEPSATVVLMLLSLTCVKRRRS